MKKKSKIFGFIAFVAVIGLLLVGCDFLGDNDSNENSNGGGGGSTNRTITIRNNTGYYIHSWFIKPSTSTEWGSEIWVWQSDGESKTHTFSPSDSNTTLFDIRITQNQFGGGFNFRKYGVTITNGMTLTFSSSDFDDGSSLPSISIRNLTGTSFNTVRIKPSVSSSWGSSFGSISNNENRSFVIPIPPSNYTVFDIQMTSTNPTNTYTRNNVTVTNGTSLTFTSADRDNIVNGMLVMVLQNNTGYYMHSYYIRPSGTSDWGSENWIWLSDGDAKTHTFGPSVSVNSVYDIRLAQNQFGGGFNFIKNNVTITEGMILSFTASDSQ